MPVADAGQGGGQDCDGACRESPYRDTPLARRQQVPFRARSRQINAKARSQSRCGSDHRSERNPIILTVTLLGAWVSDVRRGMVGAGFRPGVQAAVGWPATPVMRSQIAKRMVISAR
jgi:hypothetical protein